MPGPRFVREAKAIGSLSHPHICTLFDIGQEDGTNYLVMECLEGETLAARLKRGPLPLNDALKTAIEIGSALDTAHRAGIVHRDVEPSNVMLTKAGREAARFLAAEIRGRRRAAAPADLLTQSVTGVGHA